MSDPHPTHSILSDFSIIPRPLGKSVCARCGLTSTTPTPEHEAAFGDDYSLYDHAPGQAYEAARQSGYAMWLANAFDTPSAIFEAGAGNGSLLLALRGAWPDVEARGVEAAAPAVARARDAGVAIEHGFLKASAVPRRSGSLAFAINVIEHTLDPIAFVRDLATHGDSVAIVCPDGDAAGSELLFADHLFSIGRSHMRAFVTAAGLRVEAQVSAPDGLGAFFMTIATRGEGGAVAPNESEAARAFDAKDAYLRSWSDLDGTLAQRLPSGARVACFGAGEAAGLLRAYAPATWSRIRFCTMDSPPLSRFGDKPVKPYAPELAIDALVLATRPSVQAAIGRRVEGDGMRAIRYDDVIAF